VRTSDLAVVVVLCALLDKSRMLIWVGLQGLSRRWRQQIGPYLSLLSTALTRGHVGRVFVNYVINVTEQLICKSVRVFCCSEATFSLSPQETYKGNRGIAPVILSSVLHGDRRSGLFFFPGKNPVAC